MKDNSAANIGLAIFITSYLNKLKKHRRFRNEWGSGNYTKDKIRIY
jgi:hypothetical protein